MYTEMCIDKLIQINYSLLNIAKDLRKKRIAQHEAIIYKSLWFKHHYIPMLLDTKTNYSSELFPYVSASIYPHKPFVLDINLGGIRSIQDPNNPDRIEFDSTPHYGGKVYTRCYCSKKKSWHMCDVDWAGENCPKFMGAIKELIKSMSICV